MIWSLLADLVLLVHLGFILFVIFGGIWLWNRPRLAWIHLPSVIWASIVNITRGVCPLTPLENYLRLKGGWAGYEGGFVRHYIAPIVYPDGLTVDVAIASGIALVVWSVLIYGFVLYRWRRRRTHGLG